MSKTDIYHYVETDPAYSPEWQWVTNEIALGSYPLDDVLNRLLEAGVTAILSVRLDEPDYDLSLFDEALVLSVEDRHPVPYEVMEHGLSFLHRVIANGHKVYVHCFAGISRSAFFVACYLMLRDQIGFTDALARIHSVRKKINPHPALWSDGLLENLVRNRDRILS